MINSQNLNILVSQAILNYRDHILNNAPKCHMLVKVTKNFLIDNPHLKTHVLPLNHFGDAVILNITPAAISTIAFDHDTGVMSFASRYYGKECYNFVHLGDIIGLTAPGSGIILDPAAVMMYASVDNNLVYMANRPRGQDQHQAAAEAPAVEEKSKARPALKVVK